MKKRQLLLIALFVALFSVGAFAQKLNPNDLPLDPAVKYGRLENGLTYYIQSNPKPENQGYFYLVQNVGAVQEEKYQSGLAHFLEHMAFNSTDHFPDGIISGLEKYGAEFGRNINAYTSSDQTVYLLRGVPITSPGAIDTCLLVMKDWSNSITLKEDGIAKERKVITEEWRTRNSSYMRIYLKEKAVTMAGSRYQDLDIIGDMDVIANFPSQVLQDYYQKWYRPDLQALIVVGDFDADKMEAKVKEMFSSIPKAVNPAERLFYPIPDNDKPIVSIATDPEATDISVGIAYKHDVIAPEKRNSYEWVKFAAQRSIISRVLGDRFNEIREKSDAPINYAYGYFGGFGVPTKDAWSVGAAAKEGKAAESMLLIMTENERMRRFGVTQTELDRMKANIINEYQNRATNRKTQNSDAFINPLIDNFTRGFSVLDYGLELELVKQVLAETTAEELKKLFQSWVTDKNIVITVSGMEKEGVSYPTEEQLLKMLDDVKSIDLQPYQDRVISDQLVEDGELPAAGKIVKVETNQLFNTTIWTLSNGAKVVIKQTTNKDDEIIMSAFAPGGKSLYQDDYKNAQSAGNAVLGGIGRFSLTDLSRPLAGKSVGVYPSIGMYKVSLSGNSTKRDIETMMQLIYLNMTSPRRDQEKFQVQMDSWKEYLKNRSKEPSTAISDTLTIKQFGKNHPFYYITTPEDIDAVSYDRVLEIYKECFANAGAFTFTFTGTVDEQALKPLVEKYIASLPSGNKNVTYKPMDVKPKGGEIVYSFNKQMETPTATTCIVFTGDLNRDASRFFKYDILNNIMAQLFTRTVRQDEGGTYGVGSNFSIERIPLGEASLFVNYDTNKDRVNDLNAVIYRELNTLANEGPRDDEFENAVEAVVKNFKQYQQYNSYWSAVLESYFAYGDDENTNFEATIRSITKEEIAQIVKDLLAQGNKLEVVMLPQ